MAMAALTEIPAELERDVFALKLHEEAQSLRNAVGRGMYELALRLYTLREHELWREVDLELRSFDEYLEAYRFGDWARGKAYALLGQVRDMLQQNPDPEKVLPRLAEAGWSKVEVVRPAVRKGLVGMDVALFDAASLGRKDLERKYALIGATTSQPPAATCHDCMHLHRGDKARGDRLVAFCAGKGAGIELEVEWRYCPEMGRAWVNGPRDSEAERAAADCGGFVNPMAGEVADRADTGSEGGAGGRG